jgi:hypothetical protein
MMTKSLEKERRPVFILWDCRATTPEGEEICFRVRRNSAKYIELAEYLLENPPNKSPFLPRNLGVVAHALQTYRKDVETWVAMRMMTAVLSDPEFDDSELFPQILRELHQLPWFPGSSWKGFFYIQPMFENIKAELNKDGSWTLGAVGIKNVPYLKAKGLKGYWYEPSFENVELWKSRIAVNYLRRATEMYAEAALTGRSIGQLGPRQLLHLVDAASKSLQKALPPADEE